MKEMVDFTCQPDWVKGCPDVWLNIILGVSEGCFWMRFTFHSVYRMKQISLPDVGDLIQPEGQKRAEGQSKGGFPLCACHWALDTNLLLPSDVT